jgi:hypothetical protein
MNSSVILNIIRFILLITAQVLIFNKIDFMGYVNPYPYILFILLYPVNGNKYGLLLASFFMGIILDLFSNSGGIHAFASVAFAFYRPFIFKFSFGLSYEYQTVKINDKLSPERFSFIIISVATHHLILFLLEIFQIDLLFSALMRTIFSVLLTTLICILLIYIFKPNKR